MARLFAFSAALVPLAAGKNDGLARTPPMAFQTWLAVKMDVNQTYVEKVMDIVAAPGPDGGKSLRELGYLNVGLDDGWQLCGEGVHGSFHTETGKPLVNRTRFPDLKAMTDKAHGLGLQASWYGNNCGPPNCLEGKGTFTDSEIDMVYQGDADAVVGYNFDGIKYDGCGVFTDLDRQSALLNASGHPTVIENCHWGNDGPHLDAHTGELVCPFHMFRTSADLFGDLESVFLNLQTMWRWNRPDRPMSQPGCWAYADEMAVGLIPFAHSRANFAAWCVTSSPLTLTFDVTNADLLAEMWPIISNEEMIAVNQEWAGHPGYLVKSALPEGMAYMWGEACNGKEPAQQGWEKKPLLQDKFQISWQDNLCVIASTRRPIKLATCNASDPDQAWSTNAYGVLSHDQADGTYGGLDLFGKRGPVVSLDKSYGTDALNEQFKFHNGELRDMGNETEDGLYPVRCMAAREVSPESNMIEVLPIHWQMWAKPQLQGRVAVVVLNRKEQGLKATVQFSDVGFSEGATVVVRDLFEHKDLGTFSNSFSTDEIPIKDSLMLMLTPVSAYV